MTEHCRRAREWMLEADPAELAGRGSGDEAAHLATCADCRAMARTILAGMAELDRGLAELSRPGETKVVPLCRRTSLKTAWWAAPLAAAAAVAVMVARPAAPAGERPGETTEKIARVLFAPAPVARAEGGRSVAVLRTTDPGVTVIWVY